MLHTTNNGHQDTNIEKERQAARAILDDPHADQLARDLAHLRLADSEGSSGRYEWLGPAGNSDSYLCSEWRTAEAYEHELVHLPDDELIRLIEDPLLQNKCTSIRAGEGPNGKPSILLAYPKIARAIRRLQHQSGNKDLAATANATMACLIRPMDPAASVKLFNLAIRERPNDWRLRSACASSYMSDGRTALALDSLGLAESLVPQDSFEKFEIQCSRGKVLFNLQRLEDAKECFLNVTRDFGKYKDRLSALDVGHHVVVEYMLCMVYAMEKNAVKEKVKQTWNEAEKKRNDLSPEIRQRIDWSSRHLAQTLMGGLNPKLLSHQECHYCRRLAENPKRCAKCKVALYCSKECQVAGWKSGHKQQCVQAKDYRKDQKKQSKKDVKKREAVLNLPPLDAALDPFKLWAKAKKLSKDKSTALDAVFYFVVALFLDFSLDGQDLTAPRDAVDASPAEHPLTLALAMVTNIDRRQTLTICSENREKAFRYYEGHITVNCGGAIPSNLCESLDQLDRVQFGVAMCTIFFARMLARCYACTSAQQAQSDAHKKAFADSVGLITEARSYLDDRRWLTFQYELGYSSLDIGAAEQARTWLETFINSLDSLERANTKLTKHWKQMRTKARAKLQMIPILRKMQERGVMP